MLTQNDDPYCTVSTWTYSCSEQKPVHPTMHKEYLKPRLRYIPGLKFFKLIRIHVNVLIQFFSAKFLLELPHHLKPYLELAHIMSTIHWAFPSDQYVPI